MEWEAFLVIAILPPRSETHGGCTAGGEPGSSGMDAEDGAARGLAGVLGVLAGRGGAVRMGLGLRMMGLLGCERLRKWVGEAVGDGVEGRERGG